MRLEIVLCGAVCAIALDAATGWAQPPSEVLALTEAEALARFMAADTRVRGLQARVDEVRAAQAGRTVWPNPVASLVRESVAASHDVFLLGRQELPISGWRGRVRQAGALAVEAAEADAAFEIGRLQAGLRLAFTELLAVQARERVQAEGADDLRQLVDVLRAREQAGEGSRYDRLRGERALVDLEADRAATAVALIHARAELATLLGPGVAPETLVARGALDATEPPPDLPALLERAVTARPDLRAANLSVRRFEEEQHAAGALAVPTPSVAYGLKRSGAGDSTATGYQFSFDVTLPLFDRGQTVAALAAAQAVGARAQTEVLRRQVETDVRAAHAALTLQQARDAAFRQSISEAAEPLAAIARVAYEEGELGILELLDASRQLLEARLRLVSLAVATRVAAIDLDQAVALGTTR